MISLMVGALPLSKPRDLKLLRLLSQLFSGLSGVRLESNSSVSKGEKEGRDEKQCCCCFFRMPLTAWPVVYGASVVCIGPNNVVAVANAGGRLAAVVRVVYVQCVVRGCGVVCWQRWCGRRRLEAFQAIAHSALHGLSSGVPRG